jgi:Tol biopolymer transport system component
MSLAASQSKKQFFPMRLSLEVALRSCALIWAAIACHDASGPRTPGIHFLAGAAGSDTIYSRLATPLRVVVLDANGDPLTGAIVRFEAITPAPATGYRVFVGPSGLNYPLDTAHADSRGRAETFIKFSYEVGPGEVMVSVPELGYRDTARYTITPGSAAHVVVTPHDSVVYAGRGYTLHGTVVDVAGNARADKVTFAKVVGPFSIDATTGAIAASDLGRGFITASGGGKVDTAWVSVVPQGGQLAAQAYFAGNGGPIGLALTSLDGSDYHRIAPGIDNEFAGEHGLSWLPNGTGLILTRGTRLQLLSLDGTERTIVEPMGTMIGARVSSDGQWIYFGYSGTNTELAGLYHVNIDGTGFQRLSTPGYVRSASPSPDGRFVVYTSEGRIFVFDNGTNADRRYPNGYLTLGSHAVWAPNDSDLIAASTEPGIVLMRSDGTVVRTVDTSVRNVQWMDWSSDGRWLAVSAFGPPVTLIDTQSGMHIPLGNLASHGDAAWRRP